MDIIDRIIEREGGYINHPSDRGGATKYGITIKTLSSHRGQEQVPYDVENLTKKEARDIYQQNYIEKPQFYRFNDKKLIELLVDAGVHSGVSRAAEWLQHAVGVPADGIIGPVTIRAVNTADSLRLRKKFTAMRMRHLAHLMRRDESQRVFAAGWMNRMAEMVEDYV